MIRINQVKTPIEVGTEGVLKKIMSILDVKKEEIETYTIKKQSIDARKKPHIYYSYTIDVTLKDISNKKEEKIIKKNRDYQITKIEEKTYKFIKSGTNLMKHRPVIVGMGPAGLFCGYMLAKHGYQPIILERGKDVDARIEDVKRFWETGELNEKSNVQFGEGGAGTFSDGKLNTLVKDKDGRNHEVLRIFVNYGAEEKILYDSKPHIGTDVLTKVVKNMRNEIIQFGGEVLFQTELKQLIIENNRISGIVVENSLGKKRIIQCDNLVLAIGHSARDTFENLYNQQIPMEAKSFAVGFRVEHPQEMINEVMYGRKESDILGPAPYKVVAKTSYGRGVYSFCMCPGGYVVNASSEMGRLAVNGMSYSDRGSQKANSAIIVSVTPDDYGSDHPLAGIQFQRMLEERTYKVGNGKIPVQRYGEFRSCIESGKRISHETVKVEFSDKTFNESDMLLPKPMPCTKGAYQYADLSEILPYECNQAFVEGMEAFGKQIKGFDDADTLLLGVESRTSSPIRIHRGEDLQSEVKGLYPCGEGAGYAGGITSAAMDGIRVAEEIAKKYKRIDG